MFYNTTIRREFSRLERHRQKPYAVGVELEIVRADPAGNITIFVLNPPAGETERLAVVKQLMADPALGAQQIGFVLPPERPGENRRLEMAGGEFCGNASRSFALLLAAQNGLTGRHTLTFNTSGMEEPVSVYIDTENQTAEIAIPPPLAVTFTHVQNRLLPTYEFEGITHLIAENILPEKNFVCSAIRANDNRSKAEGKKLCGALGVMFINSGKGFMRPAVWTRSIDEMVFESSCGSGSAAAGVWAARNSEDTETEFALAQPGGTITVRVVKRAGKIILLSVSGKVELSEIIMYNYKQ